MQHPGFSKIIAYNDAVYDAFHAMILLGELYALLAAVKHQICTEHDGRYDAFFAIIQTRQLIIRRYEL